MKNILFVCHGNICRSPMAEFIFKDMAARAGVVDQFHVESAATSREETDNDVYYAAKSTLKRHQVPIRPRHAWTLTSRDYPKWDLIVYMDQENLWNLNRISQGDPDHKLRSLLAEESVDDPWYTRDFEKAYWQIHHGCQLLLEELIQEANEKEAESEKSGSRKKAGER